MIKHILLWKFKEEYKDKDFDNKVKTMNQMFANMVGKIDGLIKAEVGKDINGGNYDLALYSEFTEKTALDGYKIHPLHIELKDYIKEWIAGKTIVDYII